MLLVPRLCPASSASWRVVAVGLIQRLTPVLLTQDEPEYGLDRRVQVGQTVAKQV